MRQTKIANLNLEKSYRRRGFDIVIGIDEAGRGPLAGPVSAGAFALLDYDGRAREIKYLLSRVRDSKKLSAASREEIYQTLTASKKIVWASAFVSEKIIDEVNILEATKIAMATAVGELCEKLGGKNAPMKIQCLSDGNFSINISWPQRAIIGGDDKVFSISAASIIAKVTRDRYMERLDKKYCGYGFLNNKGYPTPSHYAALAKLGPCAAHRRSFAPVAAYYAGLPVATTMPRLTRSK